MKCSHHVKFGADEEQAGIKIAGRTHQFENDVTLIAESEEELEPLDEGERE